MNLEPLAGGDLARVKPVWLAAARDAVTAGAEPG
jgi:hypothetical protein